MATDDTMVDWSLGIVATFDLLANLNGGRKRGIEIPGTIEAIGDVAWDSGRRNHSHQIKLNILGTVGQNFSAERIGDIQTVSSIEAPNTAKLFEAWYQYTFPNESTSVLIGLHDLNTEFYVLERASKLLHSSFGNGPEITQVKASLFPTTALGVVARIAPSERTYISTGIYDGVPGKPTDKFGTHIHFDKGDGVFFIGEAGFFDITHAIPTKVAIGIWYTTATFEDVAGHTRDDNLGAYMITELPLTTICADGTLGLFLQLGISHTSLNEIGSYFGAGLHWTAPFEGRDEATLSAGIAHARINAKYRRITGLERRAETAIEVTYTYQLNNWLMLQRDVQIVIGPGSANGIDDAMIAGVRIILEIP